MAAERATLIEGAISTLEKVSAVLSSEPQQADDAREPFAVEQRLSREVAISLKVLLPKLRALRNLSGLTERVDGSSL